MGRSMKYDIEGVAWLPGHSDDDRTDLATCDIPATLPVSCGFGPDIIGTAHLTRRDDGAIMAVAQVSTTEATLQTHSAFAIGGRFLRRHSEVMNLAVTPRNTDPNVPPYTIKEAQP